MRAGFMIAVAVLLASTGEVLACGKERWPVKIGADQDVGQVTLGANTTTVPALTAVPPPPNPNMRQNTRFAPIETSVASVQGVLVVIKREKDQDYHLVIADPQNPRATMIVESPDPRCAPRSRFEQEIAQVRGTIENRLGGPIIGRHVVRMPVTVVGIPFFDFIHNPPQEGVARNGIELHPILHIQFH